MKNYTITNGTFVFPDRMESGLTILVRDGIIEEIGRDLHLNSQLPGIDAQGGFVTPPLFDLHIHGCGNISIDSQSEPGTLKNLKTKQEEYGVRRFCPTMMADSGCIKLLGSEIRENPELRSIIPGLYVEGPFVNSGKRGGILPSYVQEPNTEYLEKLHNLSSGTIKIMTLAPELPGSEEIIAKMQDLGIIPAFGHTLTSLKTALARKPAGKMVITHLFNAMSGFSHKEAGLAMLPFSDRDVFFEINGDSVHLNPETLRICAEYLNPDRMILISDAVVSAGTSRSGGSYYGREVFSGTGGVCYHDNGTLVGSNICINKIVKTYTEASGAPMYEAVKASTLNPCRLLGIDDRYGSIEAGKQGEFAVFDSEMNLLMNVS